MKSLQSPPKRQTNQPPDVAYSKPRAGDWVNLSVLPAPMCYSQAILLCELEPGQWLSWAPDYGELRMSLE